MRHAELRTLVVRGCGRLWGGRAGGGVARSAAAGPRALCRANISATVHVAPPLHHNHQLVSVIHTSAGQESVCVWGP